MPCHGKSQLYLADLSCIWLISNEALMHYDTTVGCYLEAPLKCGGIQQLDRVQGHCDRVTHCQPGLNLKVEKRDPIWALWTPSGQNVRNVGKTLLDRMQRHRDSVTHCQPGLNLKVRKKRPHLGTLDPIWAKCSQSGQNFSNIGQIFILLFIMPGSI